MSLPINKYLRDRHNAEPSIESKKTNPTEAKKETALPKEEKKTEPSRFETSEKKELSWVEKLKPKTQEPLLGGVCKNTDYAGSISEKDLDKVSQNYPAYKEAEVTTGVDWKLLAGIHYRETSFSKVAQHNPFQFDGAYKNLASGDLGKDAISAGNILQDKTEISSKKLKLSPVERLEPGQIDGDNVRQAVFRYNGTIYGSPENSPYVFNQMDEAHQDLPLYLGKNADPRWGVDHRMGVIPFALELSKAFTEVRDSASCTKE